MDIVSLLKTKKIPVTTNRLRIIACLQDDLHFHTIAQIVSHLGNINIKSVYNNIKLLVDAGVVDAYAFGGISKYALSDNLDHQENVSEIHLVHGRDDIHHLQVDANIFRDIAQAVTASGHEVTAIKIFVKVK